MRAFSHGRLILGLGPQASGYVEGWHGQRYERPVRALREYITILRRILSGERVTYEGEIFSVRGFQLNMAPPERPVRIYTSAIGPQMCRLAGEIADGVIGYCYSVPYVRDVVIPNLRIGAERAGRTLDGFDVACGFPTIVTPDDSGVEQIRGQVMMFATATQSSRGYAQSFADGRVATSRRSKRTATGRVGAALAEAGRYRHDRGPGRACVLGLRRSCRT